MGNIAIHHNVIVRAPGLLHMKYTMAELAEELRMPYSTLKDWCLKFDVPQARDLQNHVWIIGTEFAKWVVTMKKVKRQKVLLVNQAYCMRCNVIVEMQQIESLHIKGKLIHFKGFCPNCGCKINRAGRDE